ncbi:MAG: hypothetical protein KGH61_00945 [Candidatus Micrarchaeota archaeon]|nr:hypothetical protein [Candidatus Micrarchaeota archaeon]MDE1847501.1 hypothetical protein [Candidatus Micrarchaeota archaeon]MDE1863863.1 hypothetical protein [Candidatus Micrarchaeota archaeon]
MEELVKMSSKGQLVVPNIIRKRERFKANDRFVAFEIYGGVVFKRVAIPKFKMDVKLQIIKSDEDIKNGRVKKAREFLKELG